MRGAQDEGAGGVTFAGQLAPDKRAKLDSLGVLEPGERLLVFYDATVALDMSELALITDKRVVRVAGGRQASIPLASISSIEQRSVLGTDIIDVAAANGDRARIEIAALNGGDTFLTALEDEAKKRNPDVRVRRRP